MDDLHAVVTRIAQDMVHVGGVLRIQVKEGRANMLDAAMVKNAVQRLRRRKNDVRLGTRRRSSARVEGGPVDIVLWVNPRGHSFGWRRPADEGARVHTGQSDDRHVHADGGFQALLSWPCGGRLLKHGAVAGRRIGGSRHCLYRGSHCRCSTRCSPIWSRI